MFFHFCKLTISCSIVFKILSNINLMPKTNFEIEPNPIESIRFCHRIYSNFLIIFLFFSKFSNYASIEPNLKSNFISIKIQSTTFVFAQFFRNSFVFAYNCCILGLKLFGSIVPDRTFYKETRKNIA